VTTQSASRRIALVGDSTCDLPADEARRLGVVTVPLTIAFGTETYADGVGLSIDEFCGRLDGWAALPTTSQPSLGQFVATYQRLLQEHDGIVSVHIAAAMSGTYRTALAAAQQLDERRIRVIDSCTVSVGAGLLIEAVAEALDDGAELDEAAALAERERPRITVFGTVPSLKYAVRGGRVSPRAARLIDGLHLRPIIVFDETGKAGKGGVRVGFDRALEALVGRAVRFAGGAPARAMVVHSGEEDGAARVAGGLARRLHVPVVPVVRAGAVLTTHVGMGSVSVAVRRLEG
jgi:DegV family protein with EDD domain